MTRSRFFWAWLESRAMRFTAHYVVRPRPELHRRWEELNLEEADFLLESVVMTKAEGGISAWTDKEHSAQVKLVFLYELQEYSGSAEFKALLPGFTLSVGYFDEWWSIESLDSIDTDAAMEGRRMNRDRAFQPTGLPLVDAWIREVQKS